MRRPAIGATVIRSWLKEQGAEHHNEYFDVDENVLQLGVAATVQYAVCSAEQ